MKQEETASVSKDFVEQVATCYQRGFRWLMNSRNKNGVWGSGKGFPSDVLSTWHAVAFLQKKREFQGLAEEIYSWLMKCRNSDGGWAAFAGRPSRLYPTSSALASLSQIREVVQPISIDKAIEEAISFNCKFQNIDGGYCFLEGQPSSIHATKRVVQAFKLASAPDFIVQRGIKWLLSKQDINGSWGDVHLTCDMLSTLSLITSEEDRKISITRSVHWVKQQQYLDGSWKLLDTVDFTGPALLSLLKSGISYTDISIQKAIDYILRTQREDGGWAHLEKSRISTTNPTCWVLSALDLYLYLIRERGRQQ